MTDTNINSSGLQETKKGAPIGMIAISIILAGALDFSCYHVFRPEKQNG